MMTQRSVRFGDLPGPAQKAARSAFPPFDTSAGFMLLSAQIDLK